MTQLHQILAVESEKKKVLDTILSETETNFSKRAEVQFRGQSRRTISKLEGTRDELTITQPVTSVPDRVKYTFDMIADAIDVTLSKEQTNGLGTATAELVVDNKSFGTLAVGSLLALEKIMRKIRGVIAHAPTLDLHSHEWTQSESLGENFWESEESVKNRTRTVKVTRKAEGYATPPTGDESKIPTAVFDEDQLIGHIHEKSFSGEWHPNQKHVVLSRLDMIIDAVTTARGKANSVEIKESKIAKGLLQFALGK